MKALLKILLLGLGCSCASAFAAEEKAPLDTMISGLQQMGVVQCVGMRERLQQAKDDGSFREEMQAGYDYLCHCMPDELQVLREKLTPAVLASPVSESEFKQILTDRVLGKCAASMVQGLFRGASCRGLTAEQRPHPEKYCPCMADKLAALPDRAVVEMGLANANYAPAAAEAKKSGRPAPEMPPALEQLFDMDRACNIP